MAGSRQTTPRPRHVPQRTCIACRQVAGKRTFVRLVRTADGVQIDQSGKLAGRGAYLHPQRSCWEIMLKGNRVEQALRCKLTPENRRLLLDFIQTLPETEETPLSEEKGAEPAGLQQVDETA